jgi:tetratricopeptide (TPR) repeat protein
MDNFSDLLKPSSGNSSSKSGTPASGRSTPANDKNDTFADLMSLAGGSKAKSKNMASMSLQERLAQQNSGSTGQSSPKPANNDVWSGIDLLDGGLKKEQTGTSSASKRTGNGGGGGDLFDGIESTSTGGTSASANQGVDLLSGGLKDSESLASPSPQQSNSQLQQPGVGSDKNIDDIFDVFNKPPPPPEPVREETPKTSATPSPKPEDPRDPAIAELVDMGFSVEQATRALANTDNGLDVQQAIEFLMNEAHQKSSKRSQSSRGASPRPDGDRGQRQETPDIGKLAQEFSSQFLSKAGSFWNTSRKNFAKAMEQYGANSSSHNDGTPVWMKEREMYMARKTAESTAASATEEASALESHDRPENIRQNRTESPKQPEREKEAAWMSGVPSRPASQSKGKSPANEPKMSRAQKFKTFGDDDDMSAYVSPARRRSPAVAEQQKSTPAPKPKPKPTEPTKPKVPPRQPVEISPTNADMADTSRKSGNESFKRGDYTESASHYSTALESVPPKHLLRTILLSNRAACHLKLGDAKSALADAEEGISIIGPGLGEGEEAETGKPLKEIWSKLVTKKAESTEHMEKFSESLEAWNLLLNNGYSSKITLDGRRRCQAALQPKPVSQKPTPRSTTPSNAPPSKATQEALDRIRTANQEAEKTDAEKYQLLDSVNDRIAQWKGGKEDNLRALLGSLDSVLWPELGWKKVSMADLVVPKKVKIAYMKAVAKTHPDKIANETDTEKKMIAQAVFVTLNQAWESFKESNGLS